MIEDPEFDKIHLKKITVCVQKKLLSLSNLSIMKTYRVLFMAYFKRLLIYFQSLKKIGLLIMIMPVLARIKKAVSFL